MDNGIGAGRRDAQSSHGADAFGCKADLVVDLEVVAIDGCHEVSPTMWTTVISDRAPVAHAVSHGTDPGDEDRKGRAESSTQFAQLP
jgi:hypothetical protein